MKKILALSILLMASSSLYSCSDHAKDPQPATISTPETSANNAALEQTPASPISDSIATSRLFSLSKDNKIVENNNDNSKQVETDKTVDSSTDVTPADNSNNVKSAISAALSAQKRGDKIISSKLVTTPVSQDSHAQVTTLPANDADRNAYAPVTPVEIKETKTQPEQQTNDKISDEPEYSKEIHSDDMTDESEKALVNEPSEVVASSQAKAPVSRLKMPASMAYKANKQNVETADAEVQPENKAEDKVENKKSESKNDFNKPAGAFSRNYNKTPVKEEKPQPAPATAEAAESSELPAPDSAQVGQCMAQVKVYGEYKNVDEQVLVKEASSKTVNVPAEYKDVEQEVVVKEAGTKLVEIPATYKTVEEEVVITPEKTEDVVIPAKYKEVTEKQLVHPAQKVWKKQDNSDIMKLVEEPEEYKDVTNKVLVAEEKRETKTTPAVTKKVEKQVIDQPATTEKQAIPAVTKTIRKQVLVSDASTKTIDIPAEYKTVTKHVPVSADKMVWQPVMCDDKLDKATVKKLQGALIAKGYDLKAADGNMGPSTRKAIEDYQKAQGYQSTGVTLKTLDSLGIKN